MNAKLPNGWKEVELQDIVDHNHPYPIGDGDHGKITPSLYQDSGVPYIRVRDMVNDRISLRNIVHISKESHQGIINKELHPEDIIIAKTGETIGKLALIPNEMKIANTTSSVGKITLDKTLALPKYILYFMKTKYFTEQMWSVSKKSAQSGFNINNLKKFKIFLPSLPKQKKIISILEKLENTKNLRKESDILTKDFLRSVFLEMFGDPVRNLKNWKITTLGEACTSIKDGPHESPKYVENGIPFISVNNIIDGFWNLTNVRQISLEDHKKYQKKSKPELGDVLYTKGGTTGFAKFIDVDFEFSNWVHLAVLKFDRQKINGVFLESMLNSDYCYRQSQHYTRGIANRDLVLGQMKQIKIFYPPIKFQNKFANIVKEINKIEELQKKSHIQINNFTNNLIHKAFRGKLTC